MMAGYVPYTATLSPVEAAQIRLADWRAVADAYGIQVTTRKAAWEADPTPESYREYMAAVHQYRAARDEVRVADAALTETLEGLIRARRAA